MSKLRMNHETYLQYFADIKMQLQNFILFGLKLKFQALENIY